MNILRALRLSAVAGAILALSTLAVPTTASADIFYFGYTSSSTDPMSFPAAFGFGQLTTGSSDNPALVTGITGTIIYNGFADTITGLSDYAEANNLLYLTAPFVDFYGISFTTAYSGDFNLWFSNGQNLLLALDSGQDPEPINFQVNPVVAAVPEASTWAMMILGFLGLGFLGYRRSSNFSGSTFRMA
jgi:hypothetical protein